MIDKDALKAARLAKGLSQKELGKASGVAQQLIGQLEREEVRSTKAIYRIARELEVSVTSLDPDIPESIDNALSVPVVGYVGAGSAMHFHADADSPQEFVRMPRNGSEKTVAAEIRGDSLGSMFNTWLVYYDDVHSPPTPNLLRKVCVVALDDGRVLVKKLRKGSAPGLFHLESQTESTIEDVAVLWAAEVIAMTPR